VIVTCHKRSDHDNKRAAVRAQKKMKLVVSFSSSVLPTPFRAEILFPVVDERADETPCDFIVGRAELLENCDVVETPYFYIMLDSLPWERNSF
jgi:hypothetical protein